MNDLEKQKEAAAKAAVTNIEDGMVVGLGTGSTVSYAIKEIAESVKSGLKITAVSTSKSTELLATSLGIKVHLFDDFYYVDLTIDGADEIDPFLCAIKGGGGALLKEKIVAAASKKVIIIVDSSKPVKQLGKFKLPLEVLPFARSYVLESLKNLGGNAVIRVDGKGNLLFTDQGNLIVDVDFKIIADTAELGRKIDNIPGILEHGLFIDEIDLLYVGTSHGVDIIKKETMSYQKLPFQPLRDKIYDSVELSTGFDPDRPESLVEMQDFLTYVFFYTNGRASPSDPYVGMMEALHDNSILQAMFRFLSDHTKVAAIMGGHREERGSEFYTSIVELSRKLSREGFLMASGGGPGAMEATHLGALLKNEDDYVVKECIQLLKSEAKLPSGAEGVVSNTGNIDFEIVKSLHKWSRPAHEIARQFQNGGLSLAVPTWHYGHEPLTPLASHAAKFFQNSIREDVLLLLATNGIIYAPGRAGTLQEVFQDTAQNYYAGTHGVFSPMVFFNAKEFWTKQLPVKNLLESLFSLGNPDDRVVQERNEKFMANHLFSDDIDKIVEFLKTRLPKEDLINQRINDLGLKAIKDSSSEVSNKLVFS